MEENFSEEKSMFPLPKVNYDSFPNHTFMLNYHLCIQDSIIYFIINQNY